MARTELLARKVTNGKTPIVEKGSTLDGAHVESEKTDHSRWRLLDERGRQTWHYLEDGEELKKWPQSTADKYHLGLPTVTGPFFRCCVMGSLQTCTESASFAPSKNASCLCP